MKITVDQTERPERPDPISRSFQTIQQQMAMQRGRGVGARLTLGVIMLLMAVILVLLGIAFIVWGAVGLIISPFRRLFGREKRVTITRGGPNGPR
jgi:hypothetical protein